MSDTNMSDSENKLKIDETDKRAEVDNPDETTCLLGQSAHEHFVLGISSLPGTRTVQIDYYLMSIKCHLPTFSMKRAPESRWELHWSLHSGKTRNKFYLWLTFSALLHLRPLTFRQLEFLQDSDTKHLKTDIREFTTTFDPKSLLPTVKDITEIEVIRTLSSHLDFKRIQTPVLTIRSPISWLHMAATKFSLESSIFSNSWSKKMPFTTCHRYG